MGRENSNKDSIEKMVIELMKDPSLDDSRSKELFNFFTSNLSNLKSMATKIPALIQSKLTLLPQNEKNRIEEELKGFFSEGKINMSFLKKEMEQGSLIQKTVGLSDETLLWIYGIGLELFEANQAQEASLIFLMLVLLNPLISDYWIALGITQRSLKEEEAAIYSFEMAALMNLNNPIPSYNLAEIYLKQKELEQAKKQLYLLEEIVKNQHREDLEPALVSIRSQIQFAKQHNQ